MTLPRSYARLAGLQSEVNKVTVTRVAGSEVQFRRMMDTYRRDLRYQVDDIARQQQQLRRTIRRYGRKLHEGRKERRQREARLKEDSQRLLDHARNFREAKEALRRQVVPVKHSDDPKTISSPLAGESGETDARDPTTDVKDSHLLSPSSPLSNDQGEVAGATPSSSHSDTHPQHSTEEDTAASLHAAHGPRKGRLGHTKGKGRPVDKLSVDKPGDIQTGGRSREMEAGGVEESSLSVIKEDGEDGADDDTKDIKDLTIQRFAMTQDSRETGAKHTATATADHEASVSSSNTPHTSTDVATAINPRSLSLASLFTKAFYTQAKSSDISTTPVDDNNKANDNGPRRKFTFASVAAAVVLSRKKSQRPNGGMSLGDLVKLQHTHVSNTKQLFRLVDRLAARHAITVTPDPQSPAKSLSKDPRHNTKIKARGDGPQSLLSSGMAKQGDMLYAMKYGYAVHTDATDSDTTLLPPLVTDGAVTPTPSKQRLSSDHMSPREGGTMPVLPLDRSSPDGASPRHLPASNSVSDDDFPEDFSPSLDLFRRRFQHKQNKPSLSMQELSDHMTKVREQSSQTEEGSVRSSRRPSLDLGHGLSSLPLTSPAPARRSKRDSVANQLQQRLSDDSNQGTAAKNIWQSAFSRLKVLHTLQDLSGHFSGN